MLTCANSRYAVQSAVVLMTGVMVEDVDITRSGPFA